VPRPRPLQRAQRRERQQRLRCVPARSLEELPREPEAALAQRQPSARADFEPLRADGHARAALRESDIGAADPFGLAVEKTHVGKS